MNVNTCEKLEKSLVALTVTVDATEFEAAIEKAYREMRAKINLPGFRPGKAPRSIIEQRYGIETFFADAVDMALPEAYEAAAEAEKLNTVGYPSIELVGEVTREGFTFKATVPVYPEVKLGQYKGLECVKPEAKVGAADVDGRLKEMMEKNTSLVSVERAVENGDTAIIDFEGFDAGVPFDGGAGKNFSLEIGSGSFVPGFEEQVIGMEIGAEKTIDITFPENYHEGLAGKAVQFVVKVNEVKTKEAPALDDEFAKDVSEFETLKELKADIKKQMTAEREELATRGFEDELMGMVAANIECDVPDAMVETQAQRFVENFKMQVQSQGIPYEEYLKMTGMEESKLLEDASEPALRQVRLDIAMRAIIDEEKIEASDDEVVAEYDKVAEKYGMDLETIKKYITDDQIRTQIVGDKAIAIVVGSAVALAPEKPAKKATKKAAKKDEEPAEETAE